METDPTLAALDRLRRRREAGEAATKATPAAIAAALEAGNTAAEIARRLGISEGYVRGIRRDKKLQDPRYAHLKPPPRAETAPAEEPAREPQTESSPSVRPLAVPSADELPDDIRKLPPPLVAKVIDRIRKECPTWHSEARALAADVPPLFQDLLEIKRALDAGILDDLGITLP